MAFSVFSHFCVSIDTLSKYGTKGFDSLGAGGGGKLDCATGVVRKLVAQLAIRSDSASIANIALLDLLGCDIVFLLNRFQP